MATPSYRIKIIHEALYIHCKEKNIFKVRYNDENTSTDLIATEMHRFEEKSCNI